MREEGGKVEGGGRRGGGAARGKGAKGGAARVEKGGGSGCCDTATYSTGEGGTAMERERGQIIMLL